MEENTEKKKSPKGIIITAAVTTAVVLAASAFAVFYFFGDAVKFKMKYPKLVELAEVIDTRYIGEYNPDDISEAAADAMVTATGDQWSYYVSADDLQAHVMASANKYVGVGITVSKKDGEYITVESVETGGSAADSGIMPGDMITAVDGTDILDMTLSNVKSLITGEEGTTVELTVRTGEENRSVTLVRKAIKIESVTYRMIGDTGYVKIANFYENTAQDFTAAVDALVQQGAKGLVFDVRYNGGGYLHELIDMLDYLLPEGVIFRSEDRDGKTYTEQSDDQCVELPMAVLVNDMTYSAAEYFAEAIREFDWGTVVGEKTSGKGYSQNLIYLSDGSAVNLSTMKYFTPDGTCLAGVGITPDIELYPEDEEYYGVYYGTVEDTEDSQLQAALEAVRGNE